MGKLTKPEIFLYLYYFAKRSKALSILSMSTDCCIAKHHKSSQIPQHSHIFSSHTISQNYGEFFHEFFNSAIFTFTCKSSCSNIPNCLDMKDLLLFFCCKYNMLFDKRAKDVY